MEKEILMVQGTRLVLILLIFMSCSSNNQSADNKKESKDTSLVEKNSNIVRNDSIEFKDIKLYNKELISTINIDEKRWMIISGTSCLQCDENKSIYLIPIVQKIDNTNNEYNRYSYPGKVYYYEDNSLIYESRVFWGKCSEESAQVIYWLQKELDDEGIWNKSIFGVEFTKDGLIEFEELDFDSIQSVAHTKLGNGECFEIPGIEQTSEP